MVRLLAVLAATAAGCVALAQTHTATVRGTVTDGSGGIAKDASVLLTNIDQRRSWAVRTGATGEYVLAQIPPGNYTLAVESPGFRRYRLEGLILQVAQTAEFDVTLEPGEVTETLTVAVGTPLVEPGSSFLGEVVNGRFVQAMPLFARDINQFRPAKPGNTGAGNATSGMPRPPNIIITGIGPL